MKNSHEKLKAICDKIGYSSEYNFDYYYYDIAWQDADNMNIVQEVDVREIIFTSNFVNKYCDFVMKDFHRETTKEIVMMWLWDDLDNPVDFLYNLMIKEWNK